METLFEPGAVGGSEDSSGKGSSVSELAHKKCCCCCLWFCLYFIVVGPSQGGYFPEGPGRAANHSSSHISGENRE